MKAPSLLFVFLYVAAPSVAADQASRFVKRFERAYRSARTLEATFLEQYSENGRLVRSEAGTAYFRKPGKMRWEYMAPEKNLFLVDGKTAWFYVPADHTVTRMPAKKSEDWRTPLALLAGEAKVSRICSKVEMDPTLRPENESLVVLRCELRGSPKRQPSTTEEAFSPDSNSELVQIELERNSGELRRVMIHDRGGVEVQFEFANWKFDPPIADKSFQFVAPKGVAIVNGELGASAGGTGGK
jgi:outer membrane lipoprotein carrier protein